MFSFAPRHLLPLFRFRKRKENFGESFSKVPFFFQDLDRRSSIYFFYLILLIIPIDHQQIKFSQLVIQDDQTYYEAKFKTQF